MTNLENAQIIDISPSIGPNAAVFPGDTLFSRNVLLDFSNQDHLRLSSMTTTLHIGAHADAPSHYHADGQSIERRSLQPYLGPVQVITPLGLSRGTRIGLEHIDLQQVTQRRLLFKTNSFPNPNQWNADFNSLCPELIEALATKKSVQLLGIDTPSIDPADSKDLPSHACVYKNDLSVLEGLVLSHVYDGVYTLVALPLKIEGGDAGLVRAVLIEAER